MTKRELDICFYRAYRPIEDYANKAAIPFVQGEKVEVTIEEGAAFLRWQAYRFDGSWDLDELREARIILRNKTTLMSPVWTVA